MQEHCGSLHRTATPRMALLFRKDLRSRRSSEKFSGCGCFATAREHSRIAETLAHRCEILRRSAPSQRIHVAEQRRVGSQCREILEQQRELAVFANNVGGKLSIGPWRLKSRAAPTADPRDARIAIGRVADEGEEIGDQAGSTPNFSRTAAASRIVLARRSICTTRSSRTHCARSLSGVQMQTFSTRWSRRRARPRRPAHRRLRARSSATPRRPSRRALPRADEIAPQRRLDAVAGLVAMPEVVAERLDDVIGRDADVRRALRSSGARSGARRAPRRKAGPALC